MTDESVHISIHIKVEEKVLEFDHRIQVEELEEVIQAMTREVGQQVLLGVIWALDERFARSLPAGWRNKGTEERRMVSSLGYTWYRRRIYQDEQNKRRKPVDEILGLQRYGRISGRVQEMGSYLACKGSYRHAADQLSWMIKTPISHSSLQRMVWSVGNRIADGEETERQRIFEGGGEVEGGKVAAPVLYGESDGVWLHLQRENRKSAEVRVATLSTGRKPIGKDRFRLENKRCITAIGLNSEKWQEQIVREAHIYYDLEQTRLLVCGGDGNQWVRQSFDRLQIKKEFLLDRFHLSRAARLALQDRSAAYQLVKVIRQEGFQAVQSVLSEMIQQSDGKRRKKLREFYRYLYKNRDGLLDLEHRGISQSAKLGAIEGNVDKIVVHRMKGRGCSWRLTGIRAMLALGRNAEQLGTHAYFYFPVQSNHKDHRRMQNLSIEYSETIQARMPIFQGPHQDKPWVRSLHRYFYGR